MSLSTKQIEDLVEKIADLTPAQQEWVKSSIDAFRSKCEFNRSPDSDIVTDTVLASLGDRLLTHHGGSRQPLSKDRFEFALEEALNKADIAAHLEKSRTNPGHDINIGKTPVSLKTEAAANIRNDLIHVSKWMELGGGEWKLTLLLEKFFHHLENYERIFTFRCLKSNNGNFHYELVEIPKTLLLEASNCELTVRTNSTQNPQPGYGYVYGGNGDLKYSLYFDGGGERKLQIKNLRKDLCKVHATWIFDLSSA